MADVILKADRFQSVSDDLRAEKGWDAAIRCPRHDEKVWAHASGAAMMCVSRGCDFVVGIDQQLMSTVS
jgi:hypothetical protein